LAISETRRACCDAPKNPSTDGTRARILVLADAAIEGFAAAAC
jgi:hypothetical protein